MNKVKNQGNLIVTAPNNCTLTFNPFHRPLREEEKSMIINLISKKTNLLKNKDN